MRYLTAYDKAYLLMKRQMESDGDGDEVIKEKLDEAKEFLDDEGFLENGDLTQSGHIYSCKVGAMNPNYRHMPLKDIRKTINLGLEELKKRGECL